MVACLCTLFPHALIRLVPSSWLTGEQPDLSLLVPSLPPSSPPPPHPLLSASERPSFAVCCARPCAPEGIREFNTGSCPQGAWRQQEDGPDRGNKMCRALGTPEEGGLAGLPREGLSEEVICSFQQSVTGLGTRYTAANKTKGTSTLREFNSCWGASGETTDK